VIHRATDVDGYLDLAALSRVAGLSVRTLRDHIHDSTDPIPSYRVGGKILVRRAEFHEWMGRHRYSTTTVDGIVGDVLRDLAGRPAKVRS
jgi:excisionase family DNA binding protein